jgi:hypothetical protein
MDPRPTAATPQRPLRSRAPCVAGLALIVTAALLVCALTGCGKPAPRPEADLDIDFTCDIHGRLVPCGCFTGQFGGMTRLKTLLDAAASTNTLRVDVGDAIGGTEDYHAIEYRYILRAFADLHYDAINLGHREVRLGASHLRDLRTNSPVPILSANLVDRATRRPLFEPARIVERAGYKIGIVGVVDPAGLESGLDSTLEVEPMEIALDRILPALRARTDLIVLLAFTDEAGLERLADRFYEARVILGGRVSQPAQDIKRQNRSLIYFVTNESRALGCLRLHLQPNGPAEAVQHAIRLLHDRVPEAEPIRALAQQYRNEIRRTPLAIDDPAARADADAVPGVRRVASYVGSPRCVECHKQAGAIWAKSGHARAFRTLVEKDADADPKCIGCHAVGFGLPSGYQRLLAGAKLVDVGCESCHGPGSLHVRLREGDRTLDFRFRELVAGDCRKCHYGEFSRPFNWDEFWPPVRHTKETPQ